MTAQLFHLIQRAEWEAVGDELRPGSLATEGFVHCSFAEQVTGTANRYYRDVAGLCVLEIDPGLVGAEVRVEDSYGGGTSFPHLYGPLPRRAVSGVHDLARDPDGNWSFSLGDAGAPASTDR